jgi:selenocysteine lyase/cysteine desulfurase
LADNSTVTDLDAATAGVAGCRSRFPIFERLTYINSCSQGALSDSVRAAYDDYLTGWDERGAPWDYWVERTETGRATFARLVGAQPDDVAVTTSVSAAISSFASAVDFSGDRRKVVLSDFEFPAVGQIWHAQEARGAEVVHVQAEGAEIPLERFERAIDEQTAVVSIAAVCYRNGARLPVDEIARIARAKGALVVLDAYQAIGTYPFDVARLDVDVLAGGALKYLLGSAGLAFMWVRPTLTDLVPTQTGWFADRNIFEMDVSDYSPSATARRFESGTPPIPALYAGIAGIELIEQIGVAETHEHVTGLNDRLIAGVDELGGQVVTPRDPARRAALVCVASTDAPRLVQALGADGIVTSERDNNLRISAHAYNTVEDVDRVLAGLAAHRDLLA